MRASVLACRTAATVLMTGSLLLGAAVAGSSRTDAEQSKAVADFTLKDLDGKSASLYENLDTGPVLISFWATWCKPCLQEMPHLDEIAAKYDEHGLTTFAISIDKPRNKSRVRSYIKSKKYGFRTLLDPNQDAYRGLQGQSVPYVLLLDGSGEVVYVKVGYRPGDEKKLEEAIATLLASDPSVETGGDEG